MAEPGVNGREDGRGRLARVATEDGERRTSSLGGLRAMAKPVGH